MCNARAASYGAASAAPNDTVARKSLLLPKRLLGQRLILTTGVASRVVYMSHFVFFADLRCLQLPNPLQLQLSRLPIQPNHLPPKPSLQLLLPPNHLENYLFSKQNRRATIHTQMHSPKELDTVLQLVFLGHLLNVRRPSRPRSQRKQALILMHWLAFYHALAAIILPRLIKLGTQHCQPYYREVRCCGLHLRFFGLLLSTTSAHNMKPSMLLSTLLRLSQATGIRRHFYTKSKFFTRRPNNFFAIL